MGSGGRRPPRKFLKTVPRSPQLRCTIPRSMQLGKVDADRSQLRCAESFASAARRHVP